MFLIKTVLLLFITFDVLFDENNCELFVNCSHLLINMPLMSISVSLFVTFDLTNQFILISPAKTQ